VIDCGRNHHIGAPKKTTYKGAKGAMDGPTFFDSEIPVCKKNVGVASKIKKE